MSRSTRSTASAPPIFPMTGTKAQHARAVAKQQRKEGGQLTVGMGRCKIKATKRGAPIRPAKGVPKWAAMLYTLMSCAGSEHGYVAPWGPRFPILRQEDLDDEECAVSVLEASGKLKRWRVDRTDIVVPRLTFDYKADYSQESIDRNKVVANSMVAELMRRYVKPTDELVVLDTEIGLSSAVLKGATGVTTVHVPNPDPDLAKIDEEHGVEWHQCTLFDFLRDVVLADGMEQLHYWLDYCCTFKGDRTKTQPIIDVELLLQTGSLPKHGGVLAITLCSRGTVGGSDKVVESVDALLEDLGPTYGYSFRREIDHVYGANGAKMVLLGYVSE